MEKRTEVILKKDITDETGECIFTDNDHTNLRIGEEFYFSVRGMTPRSEAKYKEVNPEIAEVVKNKVIENIKEKANKYHILRVKVVEVNKSLEENFGFFIEDFCKKEFVESITVIQLD